MTPSREGERARLNAASLGRVRELRLQQSINLRRIRFAGAGLHYLPDQRVECFGIAGPVSPTVAWKLGEKSDDPVANYLADIYTLSSSLAGLPGMSVPAGFGAHGMPVGLQLIGNYFKEAQLLGAAHRYQAVTDWHKQSPGAAA